MRAAVPLRLRLRHRLRHHPGLWRNPVLASLAQAVLHPPASDEDGDFPAGGPDAHRQDEIDVHGHGDEHEQGGGQVDEEVQDA